jgi:hypothetical protein
MGNRESVDPGRLRRTGAELVSEARNGLGDRIQCTITRSAEESAQATFSQIAGSARTTAPGKSLACPPFTAGVELRPGGGTIKVIELQRASARMISL